ncbi:hypothetical protein [Aureimonas populi]|uniref:PepSY domain-containing protein n=1 Tax=Aureimonas populi TaxID=1701758 RepID=A0ABW5CIT3_9HYPH|nr:hypothetical protein [Aureimonas populi]
MKALLAGLAITLALGAATAPASANPVRHGGHHEDARDVRPDRAASRREVVPEQRIERLAFSEGFVEVEGIRLRRDRYVVDAVRPNGAVFRLAFDAYDGSLVSRERLGWTRGFERRGVERVRGPEFRFDLRG